MSYDEIRCAHCKRKLRPSDRFERNAGWAGDMAPLPPVWIGHRKGCPQHGTRRVYRRNAR